MRLLLGVLAIALLTTPAVAQMGNLVPVGQEPGTKARAPRAKDCAKTPLAGIWTSDGRVAFTVDSSGHVDTLSVMAVDTGTRSDAGLQSFARRFIASCRWDAPRVNNRKATMLVEAPVTPDTARMRTTGLPVLPPVPSADVIPYNSKALEERPIQVSCPRPSLPRDGTVKLAYVVGTSGAVDSGTIVVMASTNDQLRDAVIEWVQGCRFLPGRIAGAPVRTWISNQVSSSVLIQRGEYTTTIRRVP